MRELAAVFGMEWLAEIPAPEAPLPLREACGPRVALRHRLLPVALEGDEERPDACCSPPSTRSTWSPARPRCRNSTLPIDWCMASRRRIHEALRRLYGVGADTFEQILEGRDLDYDNLEIVGRGERHRRRRRRGGQRRQVRQPDHPRGARPARDGHPRRAAGTTTCASATGSTAACSRSTVPENIKALQSSVIARLKIMSRLDIAERRLPQDGRINLQFEGAHDRRAGRHRADGGGRKRQPAPAQPGEVQHRAARDGALRARQDRAAAAICPTASS